MPRPNAHFFSRGEWMIGDTRLCGRSCIPPPRIETQQESSASTAVLGDSFPFLNSIGIPLHRQRRTGSERPADAAGSIKPIIRATGRLFRNTPFGSLRCFGRLLELPESVTSGPRLRSRARLDPAMESAETALLG